MRLADGGVRVVVVGQTASYYICYLSSVWMCYYYIADLGGCAQGFENSCHVGPPSNECGRDSGVHD